MSQRLMYLCLTLMLVFCLSACSMQPKPDAMVQPTASPSAAAMAAPVTEVPVAENNETAMIASEPATHTLVVYPWKIQEYQRVAGSFPEEGESEPILPENSLEKGYFILISGRKPSEPAAA